MSKPASTVEHLTPAQVAQMRALGEVGAVSFETGQGPYGPLSVCNPNVLGILQAMDLTDSKVRRLGRGHQVTVYWLTPYGVDRLRALNEARV